MPKYCHSANQQLPFKLILYCFFILFIYLTSLATCDTRIVADNNEYRHYQEQPSDIQDTNSRDTNDQSSYESSSSSDMREDGLPPPNELSVIRLNDTSIVLRWEFPEDAQEHLQFFKVQYKSTRKNAEWKTDKQEIPTMMRAYQINGLRPGNFLFSVIAVYDNDDNVPSAPYKFKIRARSKIKSEEMPEMKAPRIYWTEAESDYFRFKWKYEPKDNDTEYFGFLVFYRSAHAVSDFTIYNTMDSSVEIAEVESDTPYEAKVVAYNMVGVSEFSETISIRTKPKQTSSTIVTNITGETTIFLPTTTTVYTPPTTVLMSTTKRPLFPIRPFSVKDDVIPGGHQESSTQNSNATLNQIVPNSGSVPQAKSTSLYESIISIFEPIFVDQSDSMLIVRYLLLVLLPVLFIILVLIFLIKPHKGKKSPSNSSSTNESMQLDLEINGFFKNSFPGVEKEYPPVCINVHNGFVNNHPHIDDST